MANLFLYDLGQTCGCGGAVLRRSAQCVGLWRPKLSPRLLPVCSPLAMEMCSLLAMESNANRLAS